MFKLVISVLLNKLEWTKLLKTKDSESQINTIFWQWVTFCLSYQEQLLTFPVDRFVRKKALEFNRLPKH